jgi:hypothetical protein
MRRVYRVGDLVRIKDGVNDSGIAVHRVGLVIDVWKSDFPDAIPPGADPFFYAVLFHGVAEPLRFHEMWLADVVGGSQSALKASDFLEDPAYLENQRSPSEGSESP